MASGWDREQRAAGRPVVVVDPNAVRPSGGASAAMPCRRTHEEHGAPRDRLADAAPRRSPTTQFSSGTDVVDLSELERAV